MHLVLALSLLMLAAAFAAHAQPAASSRYEIRFERKDEGVRGFLSDRFTGRVWVDALYQYGILTADGSWHRGMSDVSIQRRGLNLTVRGTMVDGSVRVTQRLTFSPTADFFEERITLENRGKEPLAIKDLCFGFQRKLDSSATDLRWVAVPFRRQADGKLHDYSSEDLRQRRFSNSDWRNE